MSDLLIHTNDLSYRFGQKLVLDKVNLKVPKNSIYGFLGPNGAGKTTTIKLLLGLLSCTNQSIHVFGKSIQTHRLEILQNTGALVETPSVYRHLSGRDNLLAANAIYCKSRKRIDEVLEIVSLTSVASQKVGTYSLGMIQRLSIALALLPDPQLLILDEPSNGLDPNGIIDIRNLLLHLNQNFNKTIFISSHLLAEVEKLTTNVGIINRGKLLFQGSMEELNSLSKAGVLIKTSNANEIQRILLENQISTLLIDDLTAQVLNTDENRIAKIIQILVSSNIDIYSVIPDKKSLEDIFLDITNNFN